MNEIVYTFAGPHDARAYLRHVLLLWSVWVVGLLVILIADGVSLIFWSIGVLAAILQLARPLLTRTEALVPVNEREANSVLSALRGGTTRDRVLRELAYGSEPVRAALDVAGLSRRWLSARHIVAAASLLSLIYVLFAPRL